VIVNEYVQDPLNKVSLSVYPKPNAVSVVFAQPPRSRVKGNFRTHEVEPNHDHSLQTPFPT
jgi:hypothetical protein